MEDSSDASRDNTYISTRVYSSGVGLIIPSWCWKFGCKHYRGVTELRDGDESSQVATCEAFPEGIPDSINLGDEFHTEPVVGDHDLQFELDPELTRAELNHRMYGDVLG